MDANSENRKQEQQPLNQNLASPQDHKKQQQRRQKQLPPFFKIKKWILSFEISFELAIIFYNAIIIVSNFFIQKENDEMQHLILLSIFFMLQVLFLYGVIVENLCISTFNSLFAIIGIAIVIIEANDIETGAAASAVVPTNEVENIALEDGVGSGGGNGGSGGGGGGGSENLINQNNAEIIINSNNNYHQHQRSGWWWAHLVWIIATTIISLMYVIDLLRIRAAKRFDQRNNANRTNRTNATAAAAGAAATP